MPMKESSAYDPSSPNRIPPSLGPGARAIDATNGPRPTLQERVRELSEIRSHYHINRTESSLDIDYMVNNAQRHYALPFTNMPLGSTSQWLVFGGPARSKAAGTLVIDFIRNIEVALGRRPSQSEAEALAYYTSKRLSWGYITDISSISVGYFLAYSGSKQMKFPFRKTKPMESYNVFPSQRVPLFRGQMARLSWHLVRGNVYAIGCMFLSSFVIKGFFVNPGIAYGMIRDSRTSELTVQLKRRGAMGTVNSPATGGRGSPAPPGAANKQGGEYEDPDPSGYYSDTEANVRNDYSGGQNYSEATAGDTFYTDSTTDTAAIDDNAMRQRTQKQPSPTSPPRSGPWSSIRNPPSRNTSAQAQQDSETSSQSSSSDFLFGSDNTASRSQERNEEDDSSPTSGADPVQPIRRAPQDGEGGGGGGGSAWDRIRHATTPPTNESARPQTQRRRPNGERYPTPQQRQQQQELQQQQSSSESYSFSQAESDAQLAKASAQKDFDEMLERGAERLSWQGQEKRLKGV